MALTDVQIRSLKPKLKPFRVSDTFGLYLVVQPTGGKLWRYDYQLHGKRRTLSIGPYPEITLARARERRIEARQLLSEGIDPSKFKQQRSKQESIEAASTFRVVAAEYIAKAKKQGLAAVTIEKKEWIVETILNPALGDRHIGQLKPSDILAVLTEIEASGRLETAKRTRQIVGGIFRLAALTDRATSDPTPLLQRAIRAPRVVSHPAITREDEFGQLLRKIETYPTPTVRLALKFQALTFVRPVELRLAKWDEFDIIEGIWRIPAERMKMRRPHDVPLCATTTSLLAEAEALNPYMRDEGSFVFPMRGKLRKSMSENALLLALRKLGYKGTHTVHGFRSSSSTILNGRGVAREKVIEAQLAHQEGNEVKRAYNRAQYWDERVKLMRDWSKICRELRDGKPVHAGDKKHRRTVAQL